MTGLREGSLAKRVSTRFRNRRDEALRRTIDRHSTPGGSVRVLDMGGAVDYWRRVGFDYLRSRDCRITLLNLHRTELGDDAPDDLFELAVGDACAMPQYDADSFDLAHSNSVIEHLGTWSAMRAFAAETRRVGRQYYVQTPNFWFPIDPHYYRFPMFHWLPRPTRAALFRKIPIAHRGRIDSWDEAYDVTDASRLLTHRQMTILFPDAHIRFEKVAGLTKSLIAVGPEPVA